LKIGVIPACSIKACITQAVRQVVFTDVLIVGRLDTDDQSIAPIGLHKTDLPLIGYSQNGTDWYERLAGSSATKLIG
jgi:hypothetical protein